MARLGVYNDRPPLPVVVGYEAVGQIAEMGEGVDNFKIGDRVACFARFGGYAEYVLVDSRAAALIPEDMDVGVAAALTTQYCTAYFCAEESVRLHAGDQVLIQAAAGGVGTALIQLAKRRGCIIYGTAGSDEKLEYLKKLGVDYPINYRKVDFLEAVGKIKPRNKMDVIFDCIGGASVKKGKRLLGSGGRLVCYGAAQMAGATNFFKRMKVGFSFGWYHPGSLIMASKAIIGVNMLRIGDNKPDYLKGTLEAVVDLAKKGELNPHVGGRYSVDQIADAHRFLESRKSMGKIVVTW
jgi:NADPH2:quinone reductase